MQCRACMQTNCHVLLDMNIACTEDGKNLFDCFNECTQLEAFANDGLPKTLCKMCAQKLQIAFNFRKCARQSQEDFKKVLTAKIETDDSVHSSAEEMHTFEAALEGTDDPLDMDFDEALKALEEPELEFSLEEESLGPFLEETHDEEEQCKKPIDKIESEYIDKPASDIIYETSDDEHAQPIMANESERVDSDQESETEPIEKVGYTCEICSSTFVIKKELKKHIFNQHKSEIICINCSKVFDMPNDLRIHIKLVHDTDSPVQCDFCTEKPSMPRTELLKHFQNSHSCRYFKYFPRLRKKRDNALGVPTPYKCKYCRNMYSSAFELEDHVKTHVFQCPFCSKNFNRVRTYYTHAKRLHSCSASNLPPTPFVVEALEMEREKPIECKACNKSYRNLGSYNTHIKLKHKKRKVSNITKTTAVKSAPDNQDDDILPIESLDANSLQTTMESTYFKDDQEHMSLKANIEKNSDGPKKKKKQSFLCSFCPRVLSSYLALETHEKKQHLNIKAELKECPICQKKLDADYIRKHIDAVHKNERNFHCDICGDSYKSKPQLKRHKLLHMKERNIPCTVCDKKFTEKTELKVHMRVHTGELPFACHLCDRRFRIKVRLTYHLQHHANIKRKCNVCGKEFKNGTSLRKHSYEHTGLMPYTCTICNYGSVKREYFITHMHRKHDKTMTTDELYAMFKANTGRTPYVKPVDDIETVKKAHPESFESNTLSKL